MKSLGLLIATLIMGSSYSFAQLSGTYTIGGTSPDYSTLSAAVSALNSQGVTGPVTFVIRDGTYSGSSWRAAIGNFSGASSTNTVTFQSQGGNPANCTLKPTGSSSYNYVFYFNGCKYVTVKNLTLYNTSSSYGCDVRIGSSAKNNTVENCMLTGHTGSSTSTNKARVYGTSLSSTSGMTFTSCTFDRGSTAMYLQGNGTTSLGTGYTFDKCTFNENYYYWAYCYYMGDIAFKDCEFKRSGSASSYFYGIYMYYCGNKIDISGNTMSNTCKAYYNYCGYLYRPNYYTQNKTSRPEIKNNTINMSTTSSTYYNRVWYTYYGRYCLLSGNTFNVNSSYSSGYLYMYYNMYYCYNSKAENNTYNLYKAGGYIYSGFYGGTADTFTNNKISTSGNSYCYNYMPSYCQNFVVTHNKVHLKASNRTQYGAYVYQYSGIFAYNQIDVELSSGTIYGLYPYYSSAKFYNNVVTTKTGSSNYTCRPYYSYPQCKIYNNTFYSYGTSSSDYLLYTYTTSSSYGVELKNNIFARSGTNGYNAYYYNKNYVKSDYNIWSVNGNGQFRCNSPSVTTSSLHTFRQKTGDEKNSLVYQVPFTNASGKDFSINAGSPDAWAVNGRGYHDTTIKDDYAGTARPVVPADGVPDLGAYEVTPTSTPPYATATPSSPAANGTQVFTFGQDTVMSVKWGASVPASYKVRQYTGIQAGPMPAGVGRMYFYVAPTTSDWTYGHNPTIFYKDPWIGDVSSEANAVIARSSNGGTWEGYNYSNCTKDVNSNTFRPTNDFDSLGAYTGVENGRIGIRCVTNPTGISITEIKANDATIDWDAVFNPIGYQLLFLKTLKVPTDADWASSSFASSNNHTAFGLDEDTKYYVYIRSICGVKDTSGYSIDSFITLITCHTPVIQVSSINDNRAVASWQNVKTATKYEYIISTSSTPPAFGTDVNKTSLLAPYLDPNTQYYIHVRAHCNSIYNMSNWGTQPFTTWGLGVTGAEGTGSGVSVYPNPATDVISVTIGGTRGANSRVEVLDMTGKVLKTATAPNGSVKLNVNDLPAGVYVLQYSDDERREQVKFNKQ